MKRIRYERRYSHNLQESWDPTNTANMARTTSYKELQALGMAMQSLGFKELSTERTRSFWDAVQKARRKADLSMVYTDEKGDSGDHFFKAKEGTYSVAINPQHSGVFMISFTTRAVDLNKIKSLYKGSKQEAYRPLGRTTQVVVFKDLMESFFRDQFNTNITPQQLKAMVAKFPLLDTQWMQPEDRKAFLKFAASFLDDSSAYFDSKIILLDAGQGKGLWIKFGPK